MTVFKKWVKSAFDSLVDPEKDAEIEELTQLLHHNLRQFKGGSVLGYVLQNRPYKQRHLDEAKLRLYQKFLDHSWRDGHLDKSERDTLAWVAKSLEMSTETIHAINLKYAQPRFAEALAAAMDDGVISPSEQELLTEIAKATGMTLKQFVSNFFYAEGEAFLQGIFAAATAEKQQFNFALEMMMTSAARLGLTRAEVLQVIQPQAIQFIEHVFADAKQDGMFSPEEEHTVLDLLNRLEAPDSLRYYVHAEIGELRALNDIIRGKLPSLSAPIGVSIKAGELIHCHGAAVWESYKLLKQGLSQTTHHGELTIADSRLIFSSTTRSESISFAKVVAYDTSHGAIDVQVQGKPTQRFIYHDRSQVPLTIFRSALAMANQVLTNQDESRRSRHIPRDVRQRIWQKYGGHCAECHATEYLEFDHIVPVTKGGSNSDANVQLLCRGCNSKKAAFI